MIKLKIKVSAISTLVLLTFIVACQPVSNINSSESISINANKYTIKGQADFENKFSTKATIEQIASKATVSLIYPHDNILNPNVTVATGLTDANGGFILNIADSFKPIAGDIFILEAQKRIGSSGNALITLRTYIKWIDNSWESISYPKQLGVKINTKTTAITIIDGFDNSISSNNCINKMDVSNNDLLSPIGSITSEKIIEVTNISNSLISNSVDPLRYISFLNGNYTVAKEPNNAISLINSTKKCISCDLKSENLSNKDYSNVDFTNSNLSYANLSNTLLTNANLSGVKLKGANLTGVNLSNRNLENKDFTNTNFTNSNLSNAVLKGSDLTNVDFTGANLSNAHYADSSVCPENSIGLCNDILISSNTEHNSGNYSAAMDSAGDFVTTWTYNQAVYFQKYNNQGTLQGQKTTVSTNNTGNNPIIAMDSSGRFVITWMSYITNNINVYAQRYNNQGIKQGDEFLVSSISSDTTNFTTTTSVAMDSAGNFVIAWNSKNQTNYNIKAKRYNSEGVVIGNEFNVSEDITKSQDRHRVNIDNSGNINFVWHELDNNNHSIVGQRYNSDGLKIGSKFKINTSTNSNVNYPNISSDLNGNLVIAWNSLFKDGYNDYGIYAQRYNNQLIKQGSEFKVNDFAFGKYSYPYIYIQQNGDFNISWNGLTQSDVDEEIYAKRFDKNGISKGNEFKVSYNRLVSYSIKAPPIILGYENGNFNIIWNEYNAPRTSMRRYKFDNMITINRLSKGFKVYE